MLKKLFFFCFMNFFSGFCAIAQNLEIGLSGGAAGYIGDLNQTEYFKPSGVALGGYFKANINPYWAIGLHFNYGKIKANDLENSNAQFRQRGMNFNSSLREVSTQVEFNFLEYFAGGGTKNFTPYIYSGAGLVFFSPKGTYESPVTGELEEYKLRFYLTEGQSNAYRNFALSIPYGIGAKVRLKENWGLFAQVGYRTAFTDYLDDVSGNYPDPNLWPTGDSAEIRATRMMLSNPSTRADYGVPDTQRGDYRKRDSYMFVGVGISFTFVSQKCYTF
ncbi:MAG: hypothetical protein EOO92_00935 [Pedobacter sp.]|nr:MAG: hypothetical protein EOO92_00935 [Pedobacter sp.]